MNSLRKTAQQLGISPAYLSYMVNGKRPWRRDLFERYSYLVNASVDTQAQSVNNQVWDGGSTAKLTQPGAQGGIRTHTPLRGADFKSAASTLSPPGPGTRVEAEGQNKGKYPFLPQFFSNWRRRADSNRRIELLQSSALTTWLRRPSLGIIPFLVPRRRVELLRVCTHGPLKTACLPIPPPRQ